MSLCPSNTRMRILKYFQLNFHLTTCQNKMASSIAGRSMAASLLLNDNCGGIKLVKSPAQSNSNSINYRNNFAIWPNKYACTLFEKAKRECTVPKVQMPAMDVACHPCERKRKMLIEICCKSIERNI